MILQSALISGQISIQQKQPVKAPITATTSPVAKSLNTGSYDFGNMQICIDRPLLTNLLPPRDFSSVQIPLRINPDGSTSVIAVRRDPLAGETLKMWSPGERITVFLSTTNGSEYLRERVIHFAKQWEEIANIKFDFVSSIKSAKIKIWFDNDSKYWSWIGRDVLTNPLGLYTMHLGFANGGWSYNDLSRIILHEFGHALGFIHEHQSPAAGILWDKEKVYSFFEKEPNKWSRTEVDVNIFHKYSKTSTNYSVYDPKSIMHYEIPAELTTNGVGIKGHSSFSETDRKYAGMLYPFPVSPVNATGILRTGDDCDLIDFAVEYNATDAEKVEFVLELGKNNVNRAVTWWKQIGIPLSGNRESKLWVQNHSLIASENRTTVTAQFPLAELDKNKAITFWKAKLLGIHTQLNYNWKILHALKGGCRVRLTWKNDSCG
jgi:hypothetical protein